MGHDLANCRMNRREDSVMEQQQYRRARSPVPGARSHQNGRGVKREEEETNTSLSEEFNTAAAINQILQVYDEVFVPTEHHQTGRKKSWADECEDESVNSLTEDEESVSHVSETQEVNELDESSSPVRWEERNQHADPSGSNLSCNLGSQFHANANTPVNQVNSRDGSNPRQYVSSSHGSQHQTNATMPMNQVNSTDASGQTRQYEQHRHSGSSSRFVDLEGFERVFTRS